MGGCQKFWWKKSKIWKNLVVGVIWGQFGKIYQMFLGFFPDPPPWIFPKISTLCFRSLFIYRFQPSASLLIFRVWILTTLFLDAMNHLRLRSSDESIYPFAGGKGSNVNESTDA